MKVHYYFKEPQHPITVNVIGVGGTGSLVLPRLARIDHALKLLDHPGLMVFAYDDDKVEAFNIGRQNFSDCDLGRNKALAIIEKCNLSFGLLWKAHQRQFKPTTRNMANITIICVDNAQFRVDYYKWLEENKRSEWSGRVLNCPLYTIDAGNGKDFGQVVMYAPYELDSHSPMTLFPDMLEQDNAETQGIEGCSYHDSLNKQDLFINDEMALKVSTFVWKVFRESEIEYNGVIVNQKKMKSLPIKFLA